MAKLFPQFMSDLLGKRIDTDGFPNTKTDGPFQCVDLVVQGAFEMQDIKRTSAWGNAIDYANQPDPQFLQAYPTVIDNPSAATLQAGDVTVLSPDHIGFATGRFSGNEFEMLEQNGSTGNGFGVGGDAIRTRYIPISRIVKAYRGRYSTTSAPAASAPALDIKVTDITPRHITVDAGHSEWDLNLPNFDAILGHPIAPAPDGQVLVTAQLTRSDLPQYTYLLPDKNVRHGFNSLDCHDVPISTIYEKLEWPLNLLAAGDPTRKWQLDYADYSTAVAVAVVAKDSPLKAYGKATRTDYPGRPVYYMLEEDFGQADQSGMPNVNAGFNTVDVVLDITAEPTPKAPPAPAAEVPADIPAWQQTLKKNIADYRATEDYPVVDLTTGTPVNSLIEGQIVHAVARFEKPDITGRVVTYVMTQKSVDAGKFNGVPLAVLKLEKKIDIEPDTEDDLLDKLWPKAERVGQTVEKKIKTSKPLRDRIVNLLSKLF